MSYRGKVWLVVLIALVAFWTALVLSFLAGRASAHELAAAPSSPAAMARYAPDLAAREAARPHPSWAHLRRMVRARWDDEHPAASRHRLEHARAARYALEAIPYRAAFLCIAEHESHTTWTISTGNGYYGGLQMDRGFMAAYGPELLSRKGTADHWTATEQIAVASRAVASRGFHPWPNTARACGLL